MTIWIMSKMNALFKAVVDTFFESEITYCKHIIYRYGIENRKYFIYVESILAKILSKRDSKARNTIKLMHCV